MATCLNPKGQQVARQEFAFVANGALSQQMVEVVFKRFKGCQVVDFRARPGRISRRALIRLVIR